MRTPVNFAKADSEFTDPIQLQTLGLLCLAYGASMLLQY